MKCENMKTRQELKAKLYVAPSSLGGIAGLFTMDEIKKGEYVLDYTGKIKGELSKNVYF